MKAFAHDDLNPAECHGDLSLQLCANHDDVLMNALIDIQPAPARDAAALAHRRVPHPAPTERNPP